MDYRLIDIDVLSPTPQAVALDGADGVCVVLWAGTAPSASSESARQMGRWTPRGWTP